MSNIVREFLEAIVLALVVFVVIQTSIQNFKVEGSSMRPTLEGGQYLLVNKLVYFKIDQERFSRVVPFWGFASNWKCQLTRLPLPRRVIRYSKHQYVCLE